jgi:hypothetical protein
VCILYANALAPLALLTSLMLHGCVCLQAYDIIEQEKAAYLASLSSNSSSCESSSSGLAGRGMGSSDSLSSDASLDEMEGLYCKGQQAALYARSASINAKVRSKRRAVRVICATAQDVYWWMMHCHDGCCRKPGGLDLRVLRQCVSAHRRVNTACFGPAQPASMELATYPCSCCPPSYTHTRRQRLPKQQRWLHALQR